MAHPSPRIFLLAAWLAVAGVGVASAQEAGTTAEQTAQGDAWNDTVLQDISAYGERFPAAFVDELVRYRGAPREYVEGLLAEGDWKAGDVYYACAIGQAIGRSCRYVAEARARAPGEDWDALARRLGVAPGSAAARRVAQGFEESYAHWARPLPPRP